ncbi:MAG TPA: sugar-binding protein [Ferruginibacter sp.]|nr:sugar-binding protein [Ferruginibacter sp.]
MKKSLLLPLVLVACSLMFFSVDAQPVQVTKTNPTKVYVHYMPWFSAPQNPGSGTTSFGNGPTGTLNKWGAHWTTETATAHPDNLVTVTNYLGNSVQTRDIVAHYHPLIGPYDGGDTSVLEYHLLLMKLSGIDGIMIDWYGKTGSNGDVTPLFNTSNALIAQTPNVGLKFGLVMEDNFWTTNIATYAQPNGNYAVANLFTNPQYIKLGDMRAPTDTVNQNAPLVCVFGPQNFKTPGQWNSILSGNTQAFLPLFNQSAQIGVDAGGEFVWPYPQAGQSGNPPAWYANTSNYYTGNGTTIHNRASRNVVLGTAYQGFNDFYGAGGADVDGIIPRNYGPSGNTLSTLLSLDATKKSMMDGIQIATWNDFSEGTIIEPTVEFGFASLDTIQKFTGVPYGDSDLQQVYRFFTLRKKYYTNSAKQTQLNQVFNYFVSLQISNAKALMDSIDPSIPNIFISSSSNFTVGNGAPGTFTINATNITSNVTVYYTIGGTRPSTSYTSTPALLDSVILTQASPSDTFTIAQSTDTASVATGTVTLTLNADSTYALAGTDSASLTIVGNEILPCSGPVVVYTASPPVIDGAADALWTKAPTNLIAQTISGVIQTGSTWQAMYDSTNLYVLVNVKDSNLSDIGTSIWDQDGVELYIAGNNSKAGAYTINDHQYRFNWNVFPYSTANISGTTGSTTGITYAIPTITGGYTLEVSIPWTTIGGIPPYNGKLIGFDIDLNDQQNNSGQREATADWNGTNSDDYENTADFGTATLTICNGDTVLAAPIITSVDTASGIATVPFTYQIIASNTPISYAATGLPNGLTVNAATGLISGTTILYGVFTTTISATNSAGSASETVTLTIDSLPAITSASNTSGKVGTAFSYSITATHIPTSYGASNLPNGLTVNIATGIISGNPTTSGVYTSTISVTNAVGISSESITITIDSTIAVRFVSINATRQDAGINVQWTVDSEVLVKQYEVQRSTDSINFTTIATITAVSNNGSNTIAYSSLDGSPSGSKIYYRIVAISTDSSESPYYSPIVSIIYSAVSLYPNPVTAGGTIFVHINDQSASVYDIRILNYLGQPMPLDQTTISASIGDLYYPLTLSNSINPGYYFVELKSATTGKIMCKLVVE